MLLIGHGRQPCLHPKKSSMSSMEPSNSGLAIVCHQNNAVGEVEGFKGGRDFARKRGDMLLGYNAGVCFFHG